MTTTLLRLIVAIILGAIVGGFATFTLTRIVSDPAPEALLVATCSDPATKEQCYARELEKVGKAEGSEAGFALLRKIQDIDPEAYGCHFIAHGISYGAFERSPDTWRDDLRKVSPGCSYGGIHGYLEKAFDRFDLSLDAAHITEICGTDPHADCNHSLGHLLLVEHRGDIASALPVCDAFTDTIQRDFCLGGVFMEQITATNLINHGIADESYHDWPARLPGLTEECRSYDGRSAVTCWMELAHAIVAKYGPDYAGTYAYCQEAPLQSARIECAKHAIGITLAVFNFDASAAHSICTAVDSAFKEECHTQIVSSLLSTIPDAIEEATAYCEDIDARYQEACVMRIEAMQSYQERQRIPTEGL
jgi:hypothetical protein